MKKKLILLFTVFFFLMVGLPSSVLAQEDQGLQNAITKAKTVFDIGSGYDTFNYNIQSQDGRTIYNLNWNDSKNKLGSVNVTIDASGFVLSYYGYVPYAGNVTKKLPNLSKQDAYLKANAFIEKVNPSLKGKLQYQEDNTPLILMDTAYYFQYVRMENNIPFPSQNVNIAVDRNSGKIQSFNCSWNTDVTFADASNTISLKDAQAIYKDKLGIKLVYKFTYDGQTSKPFLTYASLSPNKYIDANTGEVVEVSPYYPYSLGKGYDKSTANAAPVNRELTPKEKEAIENAANFISDKQAEQLGRNFLQLDSSYKLGSLSLYGGWDNSQDYTWNMDFNKEDTQNYGNASITIDAVSGEVKSFYKYPTSDPKGDVKLDENQALNVAKEYIKKMQPALSEQVENQPDPHQYEIYLKAGTEKPRQYSFNFTRKVKEAYVENNGFRVTIDSVTGAVSQYSLTWYEGELPSQEKVISLDKAYQTLFGAIGMQLQYVPTVTKMDAKIVMPNEFKGKAALAYVINSQKPLLIDANSAGLLNYNGEAYLEYKPAAYKDIKGRTGENQIKVLAQYGITLPGDNFKPEQKITQKEFLYLLTKPATYYMDIKLGDEKSEQNLYNYLVGEGIIKEEEKAPNDVVTKETAAKFIIRAMKYEKVAQIKNIYTLPFKDKALVNQDLVGYVAITCGLNIITATNGNLEPKAALTREQATILLYNYFNINA